MTPPILLIGSAAAIEFQPAFQLLLDRHAETTADIPCALRILNDGFAPALIVLVQRWPGEFSHRELNSLKRAAPLARIVGVLGPWLEGESRTGKPWPTMLRAYWHQAEIRLHRELESLLESEFSSWQLPTTSSADDRIHATCPAGEPREDLGPAIYDPTAPLIAIHTANRETASALADLCAHEHWNSIWLREPPGATPLHAAAVLLDVRSKITAALPTIRAFNSAMPDAPIVALSGFPRYDDAQALQFAGVAAVVSKPFLAADLVWQIEQLLAAAPAATDRGYGG